MRTITQMREDVAVLVKKLKDMRQKIVAENRDPNDEERKLGLNYVVDIEELEERIAEESKAQRTLDRMEEAELLVTWLRWRHTVHRGGTEG